MGSKPSTADAPSTEVAEASFPKLSAAEERQWNRLATEMDYYHSGFRGSWKSIWDGAEKAEKAKPPAFKSFLRDAIGFYQTLNGHHRVEEQYIFPVLAKRMPQFKAHTGAHLKQHEAIHAGLDVYAAYLVECSNDPTQFSAAKLHKIMGSFGDSLFEHLDEEVESLGGKSMRAAGWTLAEMRRMPM